MVRLTPAHRRAEAYDALPPVSALPIMLQTSTPSRILLSRSLPIHCSSCLATVLYPIHPSSTSVPGGQGRRSYCLEERLDLN
eukprot:3185882-Pleurochrysis_carterae.AAC.1